MKTILLIAHLIAIATGTGMSIANYINIRIAAGEKGERREALAFLRRVLARIADVVILAIWITGNAISGSAHVRVSNRLFRTRWRRVAVVAGGGAFLA
jgi:hypothetical protein